MKKSLILPGLILTILILALSCTKKENTVTPVSQVNVPDQEMWKFDVKVTNKGKLEAHLKAGHMLYFSSSNQSLLNEGVLVDFYDNEGNPTSTLTSDSGLFNEKTQDVKAIRNVVVESDSGVTLYTEELSYDQSLEKIFTQSEVKITTTRGDVFYGVGFESDPQLKFWEIKNFRGTAHRGVDLSTDQLKKSKKDTSAVNSETPDSSMLPDTMAVDHDSTK